MREQRARKRASRPGKGNGVNYKQALSVLRGYGYQRQEVISALDEAHEHGSKKMVSGLLITWDDEHGFRLHEDNVRNA